MNYSPRARHPRESTCIDHPQPPHSARTEFTIQHGIRIHFRADGARARQMVSEDLVLDPLYVRGGDAAWREAGWF